MKDYGEIQITEYPFLEATYSNGYQANNYSKIKKVLLERIGVCYWCGVPVKEYPHIVAHKKGTKIPKDMATIDHLKARPFRAKNEKVPKVLACHSCNARRSKQESRVANAILIHRRKSSYKAGRIELPQITRASTYFQSTKNRPK